MCMCISDFDFEHVQSRFGNRWFKKTVSVVIPTFNHAQYIGEAIESVLNQNYEFIEVIVVDDGSTDNTREVVANYPSVRYVYQRHMGNYTPAHASNTGLACSTGNFIVFLGADDILEFEYIKRCVHQFTTSKVGVVYTGSQEFGAKTELRVPRSPRHRLSVLRDPHGQVGAMMVKREVYLQLGGYDESLHSLEDWDFFIRAGLAGWKIKSIKQALHHARIHNGRVTDHVDVSELYRKYRGMKLYGYASRVFDALVLIVVHPRTAFKRFRRKVKV